MWSQIFYHVWWPGQGNDPMYLANTQMNIDRNNYYLNNYTPHMFTNGKDSGSDPATWRSDPIDIINEITLYKMSSSIQAVGNNYSISISSTSLIDTSPNADLRLFIALVVDKLTYPESPNGLTTHNDVVVELISGNTGKKIAFNSSQEKIENFEWSFPNPWIDNSIATWDSKKIKVVAWIQDYNSKQILQVTENNL